MKKLLLLAACLSTAMTVAGMPDLSYEDNTMVFSHINPEPGYEPTVLPLRCAFYDESDAERLALYLVVGELYEYEGGAYYSDKLPDTRYVRVELPTAKVGTTIPVNGRTASVDFWDMIDDEWLVKGQSGELTVKQTGTHIYDVDFKASDLRTGNMVGGHMCQTEEWRWRDYNEVRPNPCQFDVKKNGMVVEHHPIESCVADITDPELPIIYLTDEAGCTEPQQVTDLDARRYVRIQMPARLMDGNIKGFSGWSNDSLTVTFNGIDYNHSGCQNDERCWGGNVEMVTFDTDNQQIEVNSRIFTMVAEGHADLVIHYEGRMAVYDANNAEGISTVNAEATAGRYYDLQGRALSRPSTHGLIIGRDGRIALIR